MTPDQVAMMLGLGRKKIGQGTLFDENSFLNLGGQERLPAEEKIKVQTESPVFAPGYEEREAKRLQQIAELSKQGITVGLTPESVYEDSLKRYSDMAQQMGRPEAQSLLADAIQKYEQMPVKPNYKPLAALLDSASNYSKSNISGALPDVETPEERQQMLAKLRALQAGDVDKNIGQFIDFAKLQQLEQGGIPPGLLGLLGRPEQAVGKTVVVKEKSDAPAKEVSTEKIEKRISPIFDAMSSASRLNQLLNKYPTGKLPGIGPAAGKVPRGLVGIGESIGLADEGASELRDAIIQVANDVTKATSGMRATDKDFIRAQQGRSLIESGIEKNIRKGVSILVDVLKNREKSARAGSTNAEVQAWDERLKREGFERPTLDFQSNLGPGGVPIGTKRRNKKTGVIQQMTADGWKVIQ